MTEQEKRIIEELGHPLYTVAFVERWAEGTCNVFANPVVALQEMGANGYYEAVKQMAKLKKEKMPAGSNLTGK